MCIYQEAAKAPVFSTHAIGDVSFFALPSILRRSAVFTPCDIAMHPRTHAPRGYSPVCQKRAVGIRGKVQKLCNPSFNTRRGLGPDTVINRTHEEIAHC